MFLRAASVCSHCERLESLPDCVSLITMTRCLQKVTEAKRDREEARRALDLLVQSPVNKSIGPSYRNLIMNRISNERLATARRQVGHILEQFEHACVYALSFVTWVLDLASNTVSAIFLVVALLLMCVSATGIS